MVNLFEINLDQLPFPGKNNTRVHCKYKVCIEDVNPEYLGRNFRDFELQDLFNFYGFTDCS